MNDRFVKSASTSVPVVRSQGEMEKLLRRYGCAGFGVNNDYENMRVSIVFRVPDTKEKDAPLIPIRLELDIRAVYDALYGRPMKTIWVEDKRVREWDPKGYNPRDLEQAERVAWRQLLLWVDAACSAASAGVQRMSEAFFAHTVVRGDDGRPLRLVEHLDAVTGGTWKALLPPGSDV